MSRLLLAERFDSEHVTWHSALEESLVVYTARRSSANCKRAFDSSGRVFLTVVTVTTEHEYSTVECPPSTFLTSFIGFV
jgi:hypothetical protein